jgi:hypothetical protein
MGLIRRLSKGLKAMNDELSKPESFAKGDAFEEYVREYVFPKDKYELINRTHSYQDNKDDYIETSLHPDFTFRCIQTGKEFYVEAKFRVGEYYKNKIEWCKQYQLKRYKQIERKEKPVFLCLGIGDSPTRLSEVFIIPMSKINYTGLFDSFLDKYSFYVNKPVFPGYLWKLDKK